MPNLISDAGARIYVFNYSQITMSIPEMVPTTLFGYVMDFTMFTIGLPRSFPCSGFVRKPHFGTSVPCRSFYYSPATKYLLFFTRVRDLPQMYSFSLLGFPCQGVVL
jgi:hypothetical protein